MRSYILLVLFVFSGYLGAQDAFFNLSIGPDMPIHDVPNSVQGTRFRMNFEVGGKHLGFVLQPAFGQDVNSVMFGPRFMVPFQIGSQPLFVIPDFTIGADFGFSNDVIGLAMDLKFGLRVFYEIADAVGIAFRPFGLALRPFNIWFGNTPNQTAISVRYELMLGFAYFF
ncbi:MAG: hypothetical protein JXA66_06540 [Oligoflexia bacterium]|nr:hypothetical protein [Oligoflexia bacterium]